MSSPRTLKPDDFTSDREAQRHVADLLGYTGEYEKRLIVRLTLPLRSPRPLYEKIIMFLVRALQRARLLHSGVIDGIENHNFVVAALCVRAHLETTGAAAYCLDATSKFYGNALAQEEAKKAIDSLVRGARLHPAVMPEELKVQSPNVLTLIDLVDKLVKVPEHKGAYRGIYDFLSEFCHPNASGMNVTSPPASSCEYLEAPRCSLLQYHEVSLVANYANISAGAFFDFYDETWALLRANEKDLPEVDGLSRLTLQCLPSSTGSDSASAGTIPNT